MKRLKLEGTLEIDGVLKPVKFDGFADFGDVTLRFVCGFCGNHDTENASFEVNYRDKKFYYLCSKCKKSNEMEFARTTLPPLPKISVRH